MNVSFWYPPDANAATGAAHLIIRQQAGEIATYGDTVVFPQEWFLFLQWAVASELATGQPQAITSRCDAMREYYREQLEAFDVEDASTSFAPDPRTPPSAFR